MKILYFAPVYYSDMKQRPQQIADLLAKKHQVFYIEPTVSVVRQLLKGGERSCLGAQTVIHRQLKVIRPNGMFTFHKSVEILDLAGINNVWELLQLRDMIRDCDVVWVGYSGWYTLVRHIRHKPVIFDKMDEEDMLVSSELLKKTLRRNKKKMLEIASVIIVTCKKFYTDLRMAKKPVYRIPNAVPERFMDVGWEEEGTGPVKTIGYIGTISEWFDMEIVDELLAIDPGYEIVLVGRNGLPEHKNPRVTYLGVRDYSQLPGILKGFDVCLYNFKRSEWLDTINPVKLYEYLAANKPVLAVKSAETLLLKDYLMLYEDKSEVRSYMTRKIKKPFANEREREQFLKQNSWQNRVEQIYKILDGLEEKR